MLYEKTKYLFAGDRHLTVEIGDEMSLRANFRVLSLDTAIKEAGIEGVIETLPGWRSLLIHFDSLKIRVGELIERLKEVEAGMGTISELPSRLIEIPVRYGSRWGPDLEFVAEANGLSGPEEVIEVHSSAQHWIGMVGFTPGSPQLMFFRAERTLSAPKYQRVRTYTPEGTIGLGGSLTAIYPVPSPGGYQMLGLTPLPIYDRFQSLPDFERSPILLRLGDRVKFIPIDDAECENLRQQVRECVYRFNIKEEMVSVEGG